MWAGDPRRDDRASNLTDARRSIPLRQFASLVSVPRVRWVSLQKGKPAEELQPTGFDILDFTSELDDFADTAALVANLDLVISVDTSVVHLVGGLGKPVWLLSRFDGCWRWMLEREDSPWYPGLRIFRQQEPLVWGPLLERVASELASRALR